MKLWADAYTYVASMYGSQRYAIAPTGRWGVAYVVDKQTGKTWYIRGANRFLSRAPREAKEKAVTTPVPETPVSQFPGFAEWAKHELAKEESAESVPARSHVSP